MARGQNSNGHWNFHVKRYVCPDCKRKGLHRTRLGFVCMYTNCTSKRGDVFKRASDSRILESNPELKIWLDKLKGIYGKQY